MAKDEADIDLGVRFADRPRKEEGEEEEEEEQVHAEVAEIDQVK